MVVGLKYAYRPRSLFLYSPFILPSTLALKLPSIDILSSNRSPHSHSGPVDPSRDSGEVSIDNRSSCFCVKTLQGVCSQGSGFIGSLTVGRFDGVSAGGVAVCGSLLDEGLVVFVESGAWALCEVLPHAASRIATVTIPKKVRHRIISLAQLH